MAKSEGQGQSWLCGRRDHIQGCRLVAREAVMQTLTHGTGIPGLESLNSWTPWNSVRLQETAPLPVTTQCFPPVCRDM